MSADVAYALGGALAVSVAGLVGLAVALRRALNKVAMSERDSGHLMNSVPAGLVRWANGSATFSERAVDLLDGAHTFVDGRLAQHYGMPEPTVTERVAAPPEWVPAAP